MRKYVNFLTNHEIKIYHPIRKKNSNNERDLFATIIFQLKMFSQPHQSDCKRNGSPKQGWGLPPV